MYHKKGVLDEERYKKGLPAKDFFLSFLNADCPRIAVENPVSSKIYDMPLHSQEIQPYQIGHPYTKKTRLWLKGLPQLVPTEIVNPTKTYLPSSCSRFAGTKKNNYTKHSAKERAKTFPGIAKAMAEQWAGKIN